MALPWLDRDPNKRPRAARTAVPTWLIGNSGYPEAAGLLPSAAAKFGVGASSVSRALAKQDDEAPVTS